MPGYCDVCKRRPLVAGSGFCFNYLAVKWRNDISPNNTMFFDEFWMEPHYNTEVPVSFRNASSKYFKLFGSFWFSSTGIEVYGFKFLTEIVVFRLHTSRNHDVLYSRISTNDNVFLSKMFVCFER